MTTPGSVEHLGATTTPDVNRFFSGLDEAVTARLRGSMQAVELRAGQTLFEQDDESASLFVVREGHLKVSRRSVKGRQRILALLGPGEMFGEMSMLGGARRDGTVTAVTAATVHELPQPQFDEWLTDHPDAAGFLLAAMARRLRASNEVVADLVFSDVPSRVARLLLRLVEQLGDPRADGTVVVNHGLTQDELAQFVGAARETVNKALASFAQQGWIDVSVRTITVRESERLQALAG